MSRIKEGFVQRYKHGILSNKWKSSYIVLYSDSTLEIYNDRDDSRPSESIFLKNVVPYICVGLMTDRMPIRRPELPSGTPIQRLVAIGMDPRASKVHWLLFSSEQVLEEWFNAIVTTLPKPANPPPQPPMAPFQQPSSVGFVPPDRYPDVPPTYATRPTSFPVNQQQMPIGAYQSQQFHQQPYPYVPPAQQTVIVDRTTPQTSSGLGSGSGFGTGLAAGMGGALLGSLVGYGIGSFFAPHFGGGFGGGFGAPYGMGGGFIQDNDTYVTNNYYNSDNPTTNDTTNMEPTVNADNDYTSPDVNAATDYSSPTVNDDYGGGGFDDFGGGDWGGGGFDGGDFGGGGDW